MLTQEIVREFFDYDPETGELTWCERDRKWFQTDHAWNIWNTQNAGKPVGCVDGCGGYVSLRIFNRSHRAHRIIWLWMTGEFPAASIDHENHNRSDNRWSNLREATGAENNKNQSIRSDNTSGVVGVCWHRKASKWSAQIKVGGNNFHLGLFTEKHEAIAARKAAEISHGFHPNHGVAA